MKYIIVILQLLFSIALTFAQSENARYWIQFSDKNYSSYSLSRPEEFLSPEAIARRVKQNIALDESDLPVNENYIQEVLGLVDGELVHKSKWFNAITIITDRPRLLESLEKLPFVLRYEQVKSLKNETSIKPEFEMIASAKSAIPFRDNSNVYGESFDQIEMHRGHLLHAIGFSGEGMRIGVIDAGFSFADELDVFEKIRNEGRLHVGFDFVDGDAGVFHGSTHGTYVLSTMAGWMTDSLIGTAPMADYWLFRTEDVGSEFPIEEDNWVAAAEMADSIGIDVINSSLGYSLFDDSLYNHTYYDMDGASTRISIAAGMAAGKGILVVTSAGNSGDDAWRYITAPADAKNVLTVGAVNVNRQHAFFSSYGPTYDGRVKPNVVALGEQSSFANLNNGVGQGNGTSFASPIMAGLAACLWQAHPDLDVEELIHRIEKSSSVYYLPNDSLGHGIPDLWKAHEHLSDWHDRMSEDPLVVIYPNPCIDQCRIIADNLSFEGYTFELVDITGRICRINQDYMISGNTCIKDLDMSHRSRGMYYLKILDDQNTYVYPILKQ